MYELRRTITGTVEPVTLADFKEFAETAYTDNDAVLLPSLITTARELAERLTGRALIGQTIEYNEVLTAQDIEYIYAVRLPFPNHSVINSVMVNGVIFPGYTTTGLDKKVVYLPGLTMYNSGITPYGQGNCEIYISYAAIPGTIPQGLITAIKNIAKDLYVNRGVKELNENGVKMLQPYKIYR